MFNLLRHALYYHDRIVNDNTNTKHNRKQGQQIDRKA